MGIPQMAPPGQTSQGVRGGHYSFPGLAREFLHLCLSNGQGRLDISLST